MEIWTLITKNRFEEAIKQADHLFNETNDLFVLRNKLYALFHLERFVESIALSNEIIELGGGNADSDFIFLGIAYWLLGNEEKAIEAWLSGEKCEFTDGVGGIELQAFLYFASIKRNDRIMKEHVVKKINKLLKGKRSFNWPGAIGHYLNNSWNEEKLLSYVMGIPVLKERQSCQAYFSVAIKKLEEGAVAEYKRNLESSISFSANSYIEKMYYLAKGELRKLAAID